MFTAPMVFAPVGNEPFKNTVATPADMRIKIAGVPVSAPTERSLMYL